MANEQKIDEIVDPKAFKQLDQLLKQLGIAKEGFVSFAKEVDKANKSVATSKSYTDLEANSAKAAIALENLKRKTIETAIAEEKLAAARAKAASDFEKQVQREVDAQNRRQAAEERRARATTRTAAETERAREREILAERKLDSDRKKAFDRYEANLRRKAAADSRDAAQEARRNSLITENSRAYRKLSADLETARKKAQDIGVAFGITSVQFKAAQREVTELDNRIKAIDRSLGLNQRNVGNYSGALGAMAAQLAGLAGGFLSATAILSEGFNTALKTDAIKTSLEFTFNSVEIAANKMDDLRKMAKRLGLEYISLADSYRSFAGAAVASNFSLVETDRIFNAVANAGSKLKLTSDQVHGALNALQQMISKGTVQSEELRGQLGERLPGAFAIAARAMGKTTAELGKLLKDGKVTAEELLPKLATELDKTFRNDRAETVESLQGSVNRLKNSFTSIVETKGALSAFFTFVVDSVGGVVEGIAKASEALGIFYDLATRSKSFISDSAKRVRRSSDDQLLEEARGAAADVAKDSDKQSLFERTRTESNLIKTLSKNYNELKAARDKVKSGDRSIADTQRFQDAEKSLKYQLGFVRELKKQYAEIYMQPAKAKEIADADLSSVAAIQSRITQLKKLEGSAIAGNAIYNRIAALQARLKKPTVSKAVSTSDFDAEREIAERGRNAAKEIIDDETNTYQLRLDAIKVFTDKSVELANIKADRDIKKAKGNAAEIKFIEEQRITDVEKAQIDGRKAETKLNEETDKILIKRFKDGLKVYEDTEKAKIEVLINSQVEQQGVISQYADSALLGLAEQRRAGLISEEQYAQSKLDIQRQYVIDSIELEIKGIQDIIDAKKQAGLDTKSEEKALSEFRKKLSKETTDQQITDLEKLAQREKELNEKKKELSQEVAQLGVDIVNGVFDNEKNKIQEQIDLAEVRKQKDIESVNNSVLTEQQKADKIAIIEARAASQRQILEQRQRELDVRKAKFDKAVSIARIIANTAVGITAALTSIPPNVPLSIVIGAIGAAQVGQVLATPIPAFKHGGDVKEDGLIQTGEAGPELRINPDGTSEVTPGHTNISFAKKGTKIIPHHEFVKMSAKPEFNSNYSGNSVDLTPLVEAGERQSKRVESAIIKNKLPGTIITKEGWLKTQKNMREIEEYIKRNFG